MNCGSNVYNTHLEVDNVFKNDTIRMADYTGQVIEIFRTLGVKRLGTFLLVRGHKMTSGFCL